MRDESVPVDELLSVDREYRTRAAADTLTRIAPLRFNPQHRAWLPVLHTRRAGHRYTALFSNTARAHVFGRTHDWVVVYANGGREGPQYTVITGRRGILKDRRVIAGREAECARFYWTRQRRRAGTARTRGPPGSVGRDGTE